MIEDAKPEEAMETLKKCLDAYHDSEPASQQASEPASPQPVEDMISKCLIVFYLKEGREYQNQINIPPSKIESVRSGFLKNMENSKEGDVLCVQGSSNSPVDFCIIPVKNINHVEFVVKEITKIKKD